MQPEQQSSSWHIDIQPVLHPLAVIKFLWWICIFWMRWVVCAIHMSQCDLRCPHMISHAPLKHLCAFSWDLDVISVNKSSFSHLHLTRRLMGHSASPKKWKLRHAPMFLLLVRKPKGSTLLNRQFNEKMILKWTLQRGWCLALNFTYCAWEIRVSGRSYQLLSPAREENRLNYTSLAFNESTKNQNDQY